MDLLKELLEFLDALKKYKEVLTDPNARLLDDKKKDDLFVGFPFIQELIPKRSKEQLTEELREGLVRKSGAFKEKILELTGRRDFTKGMIKYDMWAAALNPLIRMQDTAIPFCIDAVNEAIGKLESTPPAELEAYAPKDTAELPIYLFDRMQFHPKVVEASKACFVAGNYREAILNAFIALIDYVKEKTKLKTDTKDLMAKAFDIEKPVIRLNSLKEQYERDEQEGFRFLFMGASVGIRNPKVHKLIPQTNPLHTLEYLAFASLLMRRVEEGELS